MRQWLELSIDVPARAADALSSWLIEQGAPGVIEEDVASGVRLRAHFPAERHSNQSLDQGVRAFLGEADAFFPGCARARVEIARVDEEDWAEGWKRGFSPIEVGRGLRVRPPWTPRNDPRRHDIVIEPAMAFGTGHHASTLGCLLALEDLFEREGVLDPVLDVGTGSGILAIGAARLGARQIVALDVDPIAVEAATKNAARNRVEHAIELHEGGIDEAGGRFPLILANLTSGLLRELAGAFAGHATHRGWLIVAGLLDADRDAVASAAMQHGWLEADSRSIDGWTTITLRLVGNAA